MLQVLAPTIFVYGVLGVLRGYFQAHKSMVQTSVSQIIVRRLIIPQTHMADDPGHRAHIQEPYDPADKGTLRRAGIL